MPALPSAHQAAGWRGVVWRGLAALTSFTLLPACAWAQDGWMQGLLQQDAVWLWFVAAFVSGLALNLTPCVYPMIPVTLAFFTGQRHVRLTRSIELSFLYIVGISLTYAALGLLAASTGKLFGSWLQQPLVLLAIAGVFLAMALSMFGVYEIRPPAWLMQRFGQAPSGAVGALAMGAMIGVIAAPCVGPFLIALLVFVSQLQRPVLGFWLLFTTGIGMGAPLLVLGLAAHRTAHWPKAGEWLVWVKKLLGVILVAMAAYFIRSLLPSSMFRVLCATGLVGFGVYLGWLEPSRILGRAQWIKRAVGVGLIAATLLCIPRPHAGTGSVAWQPFTSARLVEAAQAGQPVIVDVYADWCVPCVELDHVTFSHAGVADYVRDRGVAALRIDATGEVSPEAQAFLDAHEIVGVPTVLLFDAKGREREDLRATGFVPPMEFLQHLEKLTRS